MNKKAPSRTKSARQSGMDQVQRLPLRLQIPALAEALQLAHGDESDVCAMRLIEIAGYTVNAWEGKTSGAIELVMGLSEAWRSRYAPRAFEALAQGWGSLTPHTRPLALSLGRASWINAAHELAGSQDAQRRSVALSIARDTADPGFGGVVCQLLSDPEKEVRLKADKVLMHLAIRVLKDVPAELLGEELDSVRRHPSIPMHEDPSVLELERCTLMSEISDAAWSFATHRCRSPLLASLLLMEYPTRHPVAIQAQTRMRRLLTERHHPSHAPMRSVLLRTECPLLRLGAWRWCGINAMARPAAQRLERAVSKDEHTVVLDAMHLVIRNGRREALGKLRQHGKQGVLVSRSMYEKLSPLSKRGYLRWVSQLDLETPTKQAQIEPALADTDPHVRLCGHELSDPKERTDYLFDQDTGVSRHAALSWSSVGAPAPSVSSQSASRRLLLAQTLRGTSNTWVRRIADEEAARIRTDLPDSPASRVQARRLYASDPARFVRAVRAMLANADTQLDALCLVLRLGVCTRFMMDLVAIAQDPSADARVRATAVRGLGEIRDPDAAHAARVCLEADDPRLRANSLETPHVENELLVELKDDPHHRVRSSAIRKLLTSNSDSVNTKRAIDSLDSMLDDDRDMHRIAGVWAAQRTLERTLFGEPRPRVNPVVERLHSIAMGDPEQDIRARARTCMRRLRVPTDRNTIAERGP